MLQLRNRADRLRHPDAPRGGHRRSGAVLAALLLLGAPSIASAQAPPAALRTNSPALTATPPPVLERLTTVPSGRRTLGSGHVSNDLAQLLQHLRSPETPRVRDRNLPEKPDVFLRLTEARYWVTPEGRMRPEARLGDAPFVFLTAAEAGLGRGLFGLYADLGYSAESLLRQRGVPMAMVVFRYPAAVQLPRPGQSVEGADWRCRVYQPTWDTLMDLFAQLAGETDRQGGYLEFSTLKPDERNLVRFLPPRPRQQVATLPYELLRLAGGPDWEYRSLLETHLSVNPHFRGTGITQNTLSPGDGRRGVPEFVGPNALLTELAEWAVVDLGHLEFEEVHDPPPR